MEHRRRHGSGNRRLATALLALVLTVVAACAGPSVSAPCGAPDGAEHVPIGSLTCSFETKDGRRWCSIVGPDGVAYASVAFDPETGEEDYSTQRFLGFDEDQLLDLADRGDGSTLTEFAAGVAGCLWLPGTDWYVGTGSSRGAIIRHARCTAVEIDVLNRQSQVLSYLLGVLEPPDPADNPAFSMAWGRNECTLAPDFDFTIECCREHDRCYRNGGDDDARLECDEALCECIADNGYPILARVYFAAVRAFGWAFFDA